MYASVVGLLLATIVLTHVWKLVCSGLVLGSTGSVSSGTCTKADVCNGVLQQLKMDAHSYSNTCGFRSSACVLLFKEVCNRTVCERQHGSSVHSPWYFMLPFPSSRGLFSILVYWSIAAFNQASRYAEMPSALHAACA